MQLLQQRNAASCYNQVCPTSCDELAFLVTLGASSSHEILSLCVFVVEHEGHGSDKKYSIMYMVVKHDTLSPVMFFDGCTPNRARLLSLDRSLAALYYEVQQAIMWATVHLFETNSLTTQFCYPIK